MYKENKILLVLCIICEGEWFEIEYIELECCPYCQTLVSTGAMFVD